MQSVEQVQETILSDDNSYQVIDRDSPGVLDEIARLEKQLAEERRGYLMNGELLRPARVVVLR